MATKPMRGPAGRAMHATERPKNTGKTMRRTMAFILKHYKWHCLAVVICIVLTVLAQLNGTLFLQKLYDSYLSPMLESGSTDFTPLLHKLIQVGAVYAIGVLCSWGYTRLMVNVSQGTMRNFREKLFGHMESLPISYFDTHSHGDIMSVYTNDIDTLRQFIGQLEHRCALLPVVQPDGGFEQVPHVVQCFHPAGVHGQFFFRQDMVDILAGRDPAEDILLPLDEAEVLSGGLSGEAPRLTNQGDGLLVVGQADVLLTGGVADALTVDDHQSQSLLGDPHLKFLRSLSCHIVVPPVVILCRSWRLANTMAHLRRKSYSAKPTKNSTSRLT